MKITKLAILDDYNLYGERLAEKIRQALPETEVIVAASIETLAARTSDIDVLITWHISQKTEEFLRNAPSLKWVHAMTAGVDQILKSGLRNMDVKFSANKGIHGPQISDHIIAFIFSFLRSFPALGAYQRKKEWYKAKDHPEHEPLAAEESFNKTVGVIGLGTIGLCIAKKCKQVGMRVVGVQRTPRPSEWLDACYGTADLAKLLQESDFVVLATPFTPETANMIGEKELYSMKKTAHLINISRGAVVNEKALIKALQEKAIAGAGLDAFVDEPLSPESPLWDMPNVIITPHISAWSKYLEHRSVNAILENVLRYSRGDKLLHEVDKTLGY